MKKLSVLFFLPLLCYTYIYANDTYILTYSKEQNCTLTKNGKKIPLIDKRFDSKPPKNGYTCSAVQKEKYNDCIILKKKNITAQIFAYGTYERTNLVMAFKTATPYTKGMMKVECTKSLKKLSK